MNREPKARVAFIGTRGLPPRYGGRETAADEVGCRLVARGWDALVYCRNYNTAVPRPQTHRGVRLVHLPALRNKNLDTPLHVLLSILHLVLRERARLVVLSGSGTSFAIPFLHLLGRRTILWVDGKAWTRGKWGRLARWFLERSARFGVRYSDAIVTDTPLAHRFYREEMGRETDYIPYGANIEAASGEETLQRLGVAPYQYLLFVGRLVPEKGVQYLIEAFEQLETEYRLVIVGDDPYHPNFVRELKSTKDRRIIFPGYVFGEGFHQLMKHCRLYVQPSDVEGTAPVLLTAMAHARPIVVNGIPENKHTIGDAGWSFPPGDVSALRSLLEKLVDDEEALAEMGRRALARVRTHYDWDRITDQFESLLQRLQPSTASEARGGRGES